MPQVKYESDIKKQTIELSFLLMCTVLLKNKNMYKLFLLFVYFCLTIGFCVEQLVFCYRRKWFIL